MSEQQPGSREPSKLTKEQVPSSPRLSGWETVLNCGAVDGLSPSGLETMRLPATFNLHDLGPLLSYESLPFPTGRIEILIHVSEYMGKHILLSKPGEYIRKCTDAMFGYVLICLT